jgi:hypothetical protein
MKYLIGLVIAIFVILFIIIRLLTGGSRDAVPAPTPLSDYATTDTIVRYTVDNPVQAGQTHNDIIVSIGKNNANMTITRGYEGEVVSSKDYPMSTTSYKAFLMSLDRTGLYTKGVKDDALRDETGICATGERFIYEIVGSNEEKIQHLWSTSCGSKTFQGNIDAVQSLFQSQIPDYDALTQDINF